MALSARVLEPVSIGAGSTRIRPLASGFARQVSTLPIPVDGSGSTEDVETSARADADNSDGKA
jgi:hypothetical protein